MSRALTSSCPLCGANVRWRVEEEREALPEHRAAPATPICPRCAASAARMIYDQDPERIDRAWASIDPAYGRGEGILPLPVRLRAHPYYRGRGVTICIVDSDFVFHPDLMEPTPRIIAYVDASRERVREGVKPPPPHSGSWHGTMTSVVAAGNGHLSGGRYRGLAPDANVVLVRVSDTQGRIKERDILRGLRWILRRGAQYQIRVVNLSLGGDDALPSGLSEVDRAVEDLVASGVVVVAAAGNAGARSLTPPASAKGAITVGGLDDRGGLDPRARSLWHSNYGPTRDGVLKPEIIAPSLWVPAPIVPGTQVAREAEFLDRLGRLEEDALIPFLESYPNPAIFPPELVKLSPEGIRRYAQRRREEGKFLDAHYQHVEGTSFAAPAVSGTVAQMLEADPTLTPRRVKEILMRTAAPLQGVPQEAQGRGVVQPGRAVLGALRAARPQERVRSPIIEKDRVRFAYRDPERKAERVELCLALFDWRPLVMLEETPGVFGISLPLPREQGNYLYKFLLDGSRWREDPENPERVPDGFGGWNSVLRVQAS